MGSFGTTHQTLEQSLQTLGGFSSGSPGVTRPVYGEPWCDAHRWLAALARDLGLDATSDAVGNLLFHDPAVHPGDLDRPVLMIGSHLDSAAGGGLYDGAYGLLSALLVAAESRGRGELPVVAFATCCGGEDRLGPCDLGARGLLGSVRREDLEVVIETQVTTWRRSLAQAGARGCAAPLAEGDRPCPALFRPAVVVELHIEQGPVLDSELLDLGLVEQVMGCRRMRLLLTGEARRGGATPMSRRRDALAAAAEMVLAAGRLARKAGPPAVATSGFMRAEPGIFGMVAGTSELGIEVRHAERGKLVELAAAVGQQCRTIAEEHGIEIALEESAGHEPVAMSAALIEAAEKTADRLRLSHRRLASGAAHDVAVFARHGVPALLIFVPSRHGVAHSPDEFTEPIHLQNGQRFLLELARWLTEGKG